MRRRARDWGPRRPMSCPRTLTIPAEGSCRPATTSRRVLLAGAARAEYADGLAAAQLEIGALERRRHRLRRSGERRTRLAARPPAGSSCQFLNQRMIVRNGRAGASWPNLIAAPTLQCVTIHPESTTSTTVAAAQLASSHAGATVTSAGCGGPPGSPAPTAVTTVLVEQQCDHDAGERTQDAREHQPAA